MFTPGILTFEAVVLDMCWKLLVFILVILTVTGYRK